MRSAYFVPIRTPRRIFPRYVMRQVTKTIYILDHFLLFFADSRGFCAGADDVHCRGRRKHGVRHYQ